MRKFIFASVLLLAVLTLCACEGREETVPEDIITENNFVENYIEYDFDRSPIIIEE